MNSDEYKRAVTRVGLSQIGAGRFFGVDERTGQRWGSGESKPPQSIAKLLRLMMHLKLSAAELDEVITGRLVLIVKKQPKELTKPAALKRTPSRRLR